MTSDTPTLPEAAHDAGWRGLATDVARCLRFYSRLPTPVLPWERDPHAVPDFATMPRALPVAGAVIGAVGALALAVAGALGFPPGLSAALAVAAIVVATGAFHEDGLADAADGLWGGHTPERRLDIMRDSRIGSYGGAALILSLGLRIAALAAILDRGGAAAGAAALILNGALTRTAALNVMVALEPARSSGASYAVGRPLPRTVAVAWAGCAALAVPVALLAPLPPGGIALAFGAAAAAAHLATRLSRRLIGGYTGDVGGATQQIAEIAALLALLASLRP
ncbi:MAG TPA: adenosylcobinamide-GDP ribazoletransferase [Salinarimonas sp.]|nr:adenosylcobinamide-GDP ribazoletransferase [Salinarimonas sp.]